MLVDLVLKDIRIDRADGSKPDRATLPASHLQHRDAVRKIPQNMHGERRAAAGDAMDFGGVRELLFGSVAAAAGCRNLPNRVPVFANPQLGNSIRKSSSRRWIDSV